MFKPPPSSSLTDRSKAVVLLWFSVAYFGVRVSVTFYLMCVHIIFSSVVVAEWPPVRKELLTRLVVCSLCILTTVFVILVIPRFGFDGWNWVPIASVIIIIIIIIKSLFQEDDIFSKQY